MRSCEKHYFNMIEVVLALAVALVGALCVMILLPVGLNAQRDAVADNYLPDVSQELLTYVQTIYNSDYTGVSDIPGGKPSQATVEASAYPSGVVSDVFGRSTDQAGGFVVASTNANDGCFLIFQQSVVDEGGSILPVKEFEGEAVMWYETVTADVGNSSADFREWTLTNMDPFVYRLNVEVSWPYNIPYERRVELGNVRTYSFYLYNTKAQL